MCLGIPMQVQSVESNFAMCLHHNETRRIGILLVGDCKPGDWLLCFLDDARELIDSRRAQEINSTLAMLQQSMQSDSILSEPDFILPSSLALQQIKNLTQPHFTDKEIL